ncbi:hypothetical protein ONZ51_g13599 [Trametes cubensis]|uniref:Uncharacterized protein n=1 Tax=Trametes cubensis TaxID=1111947 RepID=A0AAD7TG93_9APHY|nr:hypothetical protein ONZ51_g13599 [Trametes cubensis]
MRARHTAPSAEFMNMGILKRRGGPRTWYGVGCPGGITSPFKREGGTTMPGLERPTNPLASRSSLESDESPTAYTPGSYTDSVLEKVHAAGKMREYHFRLASLQLGTTTGASETGLMGLDGHESEGGHQHGYMMDPEKAEYAGLTVSAWSVVFVVVIASRWRHGSAFPLSSHPSSARAASDSTTGPPGTSLRLESSGRDTIAIEVQDIALVSPKPEHYGCARRQPINRTDTVHYYATTLQHPLSC